MHNVENICFGLIFIEKIQQSRHKGGSAHTFMHKLSLNHRTARYFHTNKYIAGTVTSGTIGHRSYSTLISHYKTLWITFNATSGKDSGKMLKTCRIYVTEYLLKNTNNVPSLSQKLHSKDNLQLTQKSLLFSVNKNS